VVHQPPGFGNRADEGSASVSSWSRQMKAGRCGH